MSYPRELVKAELVALGWLVACAAAFSLFMTVSSTPGSTLSDSFNQVVFLFLVFCAFGLLPVLVYGAPVYALLRYRRLAKWWSALLAGVLPGLAIFPLDPSIGVYALATGSVVSLLTHLVIARGANNSFKPNPLRGSA